MDVERDFSLRSGDGNNGNITALRTDAQKAADYRTELMPVLEQAAAIMTRARRDGLAVGFNLGVDGSNRTVVQNFDITKSLL